MSLASDQKVLNDSRRKRHLARQRTGLRGRAPWVPTGCWPAPHEHLGPPCPAAPLRSPGRRLALARRASEQPKRWVGVHHPASGAAALLELQAATARASIIAPNVAGLPGYRSGEEGAHISPNLVEFRIGNPIGLAIYEFRLPTRGAAIGTAGAQHREQRVDAWVERTVDRVGGRDTLVAAGPAAGVNPGYVHSDDATSLSGR